MANRKNRILVCTLALAIVAAVASLALLNAPKASAAEDALAKIREKGSLVIGTEGNWSPWTYHDEEDRLTGFDVEIGRLLAEELGVEADFQEAPWDSLLAGVDAGRFDIICNGVGYTVERAKSYSFTDPYCYSKRCWSWRRTTRRSKPLKTRRAKRPPTALPAPTPRWRRNTARSWCRWTRWARRWTCCSRDGWTRR